MAKAISYISTGKDAKKKLDLDNYDIDTGKLV